jgi:hypothetical protein
MPRPIVPVLMVLVAVVSLGGMAFPSIPTVTTTSHLITYSESTATGTSTTHMVETLTGGLITEFLYLFTLTDVYGRSTAVPEICAQYFYIGIFPTLGSYCTITIDITPTVTTTRTYPPSTLQLFLTRTSTVPFAANGQTGIIAVLLGLVLLLAGIGLLLRNRITRKKDLLSKSYSL